ncbi:MAG: hypothetical protein R2755_28485 [Acidimicrobiales bacterium]
MPVTSRQLTCHRCARTFERKPFGRRPLYCGRTCRQRAYEARRRGAEHLRLPAPELAFPPAARSHGHHPIVGPSPHHYEPGHGRTATHALRPDGPADADGRRPTLCGTTARPLRVQRRFGVGPYLKRTCTTCTAVAERFPLAQPIDPPAELSRLKHLLRNARGRVLDGDQQASRLLLEQLYRLTSAS